MKRKFGFKQAAVAAALAMLGSAAQAFVLDNTNLGVSNLSTFNWSFLGGGYDLKGDGSITATGFNTDTLTLAITLTNNTVTTDTDGKNARLTAFGFGIDPNTGGVTFSDGADGGMVDASLDSIPSLKSIEVCAYGGVNCPGGSNGGIFGDGTSNPPGSDTFSLSLTREGGGVWGTSVDIDPLGWKYQTNNGSFEFTSSSGRPISSGPVPEPGTLSLLGGAMLAGLFRYRQRRQAQA